MSRKLVLSALALVVPLSVTAQENLEAVHDPVRVRITNLTKGQPFSRIVVATHRPGLHVFELGAPAPPSLVALAQDANPAPLARRLADAPEVRDVAVTDEILRPGESITLVLRGAGPHGRVSAFGMLLVTNDGFFALSGAHGAHSSPALDAGSEWNDEQCASIPGPFCGGNGGLGGEGYVYVHNGIHGIGDLEPQRRDFRNPVARIEIRRIGADEEIQEP